MSSTNRGAERRADDFYETPEWAIQAILPHLPHFGSALEPASGGGAIMEVLRREYPVLSSKATEAPLLWGMEIDGNRAVASQRSGLAVDAGDFLHSEKLPFTPGQFDLIITNPPYSLAMEFVKQSLWLAGRRGHVCMLLRLAWLASAKRAPFHRAYPSDVYVLSKRPSFTGDKKTDSSDYAWFTWGPSAEGRWKVI